MPGTITNPTSAHICPSPALEKQILQKRTYFLAPGLSCPNAEKSPPNPALRNLLIDLLLPPFRNYRPTSTDQTLHYPTFRQLPSLQVSPSPCAPAIAKRYAGAHGEGAGG